MSDTFRTRLKQAAIILVTLAMVTMPVASVI
jgi:hypothetical protein